MAADVFINYRGVDAGFVPTLLFERLAREFGGRRVFLDAETIAPGEDYVQRLLSGVRSAKVLLAVIGPRWLEADANGARLIDDPDDWIRRELVTAFACGVTVIPVFTEGVTPPRPADLPADIAQLGRQNGLPLRRVRSGDDIETIVRTVANRLPRTRRRGPRLAVAAAVLVAAIAVGAVLASVLRQDPPDPVAGPSHTPAPTTTTTVPPTTTTTTTTTAEPPPAQEPAVWWEGTLTFDADTFVTGYSLDTSPPSREPAGDIGLVCQLDCATNQVAGTEFVPWTGPGFPTREQCVDLLNANPGQRSLSVKAGTKACLGTVERRVGHLDVASISGPGRMKVHVQVWDLPAG